MVPRLLSFIVGVQLGVQYVSSETTDNAGDSYTGYMHSVENLIYTLVENLGDWLETQGEVSVDS